MLNAVGAGNEHSISRGASSGSASSGSASSGSASSAGSGGVVFSACAACSVAQCRRLLGLQLQVHPRRQCVV